MISSLILWVIWQALTAEYRRASQQKGSLWFPEFCTQPVDKWM